MYIFFSVSVGLINRYGFWLRISRFIRVVYRIVFIVGIMILLNFVFLGMGGEFLIFLVYCIYFLVFWIIKNIFWIYGFFYSCYILFFNICFLFIFFVSIKIVINVCRVNVEFKNYFFYKFVVIVMIFRREGV